MPEIDPKNPAEFPTTQQWADDLRRMADHPRQIRDFNPYALRAIADRLELLTEERDQYAAVIAAGFKAFDNLKLRGGASGPGEPYIKVNISVFESALAILTADSTATLAAHDAEMKAEGWDEGWNSRWDGRALVRHVNNPYRAPQQGDPE